MGYIGKRKVESTFYINKERTETMVTTVTFVSYGRTMEDARESLARQMANYTDNPFNIEVVPISEYFETV